MLSPKKVKNRKLQKGRTRGVATRGTELAFGDYGIKAMEHCWVTNRQIEAARIAISRYMKRRGKMWIRVFPDKPYTKKPLEVRMGTGKGGVEGWVAVVRPATILFEVAGIPEEMARESMRLAATKLMIRTKFISRHHAG